jgi:hypothetical protein
VEASGVLGSRLKPAARVASRLEDVMERVHACP